MVDHHDKVVVGTSGYSFADWVGPFYPPGTRQKDMFALYAAHFQAVELNFTFYNASPGATLARMSAKAPDNFGFWVKANQALTHKGNVALRNQRLSLQHITDRCDKRSWHTNWFIASKARQGRHIIQFQLLLWSQRQ